MVRRAAIDDLHVDVDPIAAAGPTDAPGAVPNTICAGDAVFGLGCGAKVPDRVHRRASHRCTCYDQAAIGRDVGVSLRVRVADRCANLTQTAELAVHIDARW